MRWHTVTPCCIEVPPHCRAVGTGHSPSAATTPAGAAEATERFAERVPRPYAATRSWAVASPPTMLRESGARAGGREADPRQRSAVQRAGRKDSDRRRSRAWASPWLAAAARHGRAAAVRTVGAKQIAEDANACAMAGNVDGDRETAREDEPDLGLGTPLSGFRDLPGKVGSRHKAQPRAHEPSASAAAPQRGRVTDSK